MKRALSLIPLTLLAACVARPGDPATDPSVSSVHQAANVWQGTQPQCPSGASTCVPVSQPSELDAACPKDRFIAVIPAGQSCPQSIQSAVGGSWVGGPLFPAPRPPGLAPFCAYDWTPNSPSQSAPPDEVALNNAFSGALANSKLNPDCHAVASLGKTAAIEAGWTIFHSDFHAQAGRLAGLPFDPAKPPNAIRVAVVDSSPHGYSGGEAGAGQLSHGLVMGEIIRELGCPAGSGSATSACISQISNHLALAQIDPTHRDVVNGGFYGLLTQTALAVENAVRDWDLHNAGAPAGAKQPRLVINLSIGWDGRYGGPYATPSDLAAPVRAVHTAITHAVCRGAVVIASAGNDPGGPSPAPGPVFPAAWELKPAPTPAQCAELEGQGYPPSSEYPLFPPASRPDVYQPLVFAAGGVRGDDRPIAVTRNQGRSRLAAPAAHALAAVTTSSGIGPTDMYTGTSVSAAVASGIASTVWGYRPHLSGAEIMDLVRQGSVPLGSLAAGYENADFCLGGLPCPWPLNDARRIIRRVSLCQAVTAACGSGPVDRCPGAVPACTPRPAYSGTVPHLDAAGDAYVASKITSNWDPTTTGTYWTLSPGVAVCGHADFTNTSATSFPLTTCPFRQFYSSPLKPWVGPQPSANPCPACDVWLMAAPPPSTEADGGTETDGGTSGGGTTYEAALYMGIDPQYTTTSGATLEEPTVLVNDTHEIKLTGVGPVYAGEHKVIRLPFETSWGPIHRVTLNFRSMRNGQALSTTSELIIRKP